MEINTILIISSLVFQLITEIRRSRCSHIELSTNGLILDREVMPVNEDKQPPTTTLN
tara:strand:+ start:5 stop:175 length:171 start_codon:yes stop_codon:yes gene_type:complete